MSKHNTVLISEYDMPKDRFVEIWQKETKANFDSKRSINKTNTNRIEKLFIVRY